MEQLDKYGFDHPTNTIVSGPSGSGKSQILGRILGCADYIFDPAPVKKILFYREEQSLYDHWRETGLVTHMQKGMPERDELLALITENKDEGGSVVIFDDCASLIEENKEDFNYYFTIASHHYKASFFLVLHSLFSPALRLLSLNTHRFILTQSPRDVSQVRTLASQSFPGRTQFVVDSYEDSTDGEFGFLILDFSPRCDKRLRVVGNIFSNEPISVYLCKKVGRSRSDKMEKAFKKQALIPWSDYLNLQEKQAKNAALSNHQPCKQGAHCNGSSNRNVYSVVSNPNGSDRGLGNNNNPDQQTSKEELVGETSGLPTQLHSVTPANDEGKPIIQSPTQAFAKPSQHKEQVLSLVAPDSARHSMMEELKHKLAGRPQRTFADPRDTHSTPPAGTQPLQQMGIRDAMMVELRQKLASREQRNEEDMMDLALDQKSPNLPIENAQAYNLQHSLPVENGGEIHPQPLAITYDSAPTNLSVPYTPPPAIKALEDKSSPITALENRSVSAPDSSYPLSLVRDPDVQPNPASFPPSIQDKRSKKKKIKKNIFKPSPPIEARDQGGGKIKALKRSGSHLTKARPTLAPKHVKINRGEKRKNTNDEKHPKKALKTHPLTLESTDYDIWRL